MQKTKQLVIIPKVGGLYQFRSDNVEALDKKYGFHYTGLVMCLEEDILKYLDKPDRIFTEPSTNILYRFETYNCNQIFASGHIYNTAGVSIIRENLFFSLNEIQDILKEIGAGTGEQ